jgi:microcompartment protein CcmK/EutM
MVHFAGGLLGREVLARMDIARVVGSVVATARSDGLDGRPLRLVRPSSEADEISGAAYVAIDRVGAGTGELVLVVRGGAARVAVGESVEVDAAIVAIVDRVDVDGQPTYRKA